MDTTSTQSAAMDMIINETMGSSNAVQQSVNTQHNGGTTDEHDDGRASPNPKRVRYDPSCCICMEAFEQSDALYLLPCQHYFHQTW